MVHVARLQRLVEQLQPLAQPALPSGLIALQVAGVRVGLVQPSVARFIADRVPAINLSGDVLATSDDANDYWARTALLAEAALKLRDAGLITGWRNESLAVGRPALAAIERAACRPLGITTEAVHINGYAGADTLIVARRAAHKQIDPGLWDNLVGGMVAAGETLQQTLEREAWEEAGLRLDAVSVARGRSFQMCRPVAEGLQSEIIHVYDAMVSPKTSLANQDGEVAAIERRTLRQVVEAIEHDEFTLEAGLVTLESLTRRLGPTTSRLFVNQTPEAAFDFRCEST